MKKWKLPPTFATKSAAEYFKEICELNKNTKNFSQRELAKFLEWPMSYIPDVMKLRKPLTVARALEFIRLFKIYPVDAEHLIFLAVASQSKTEIPALQELRRIKSPIMRNDSFPELTIFNFESMLTCQAISVLSPQATLAQIELLLMSRQMTSEAVRASLALLLDKRLIEKNGKLYSCKFEKAYSNIDYKTDEMRRLQQDFLESTKRFFDNPFKPGTGSSAFVVIDGRRYADVREKIQTLKNWILEISTLDAQGVQANNILFQLDLHLLPVFHPDRLAEARLPKAAPVS